MKITEQIAITTFRSTGITSLKVRNLLHVTTPSILPYLNAFSFSCSGNKKKFTKLTAEDYPVTNLPYDFASVTHYQKNSWAANKNTWTIRAKKDAAMVLGNNRGYSDGDYDKIRKLYRCWKWIRLSSDLGLLSCVTMNRLSMLFSFLIVCWKQGINKRYVYHRPGNMFSNYTLNNKISVARTRD